MSQFPLAIERFDARVDRSLERIRGHRFTDTLFRSASRFGDFSLIWHVTAIVYALAARRPFKEALLFIGLIGAESLIVNQGIKRIFRRRRPTDHGDPRFPVRKPHSSSFPSGHASAACFAATLLTVWVGLPTAPNWFLMAAIVGGSRAYVRIHFASDVLGGVVTGLALAQIALLTGAADWLR